MKFYKMRNDDKFPSLQRDMDCVRIESVHCPLSPGHQRSSPRLNDLTVISQSEDIADISWTFFSECVITNRVAEILAREKISGYTLELVTVSSVSRRSSGAKTLPTLWELKVNGWGGMAGESSGVRLIRSCEACGHLKYSTFTDPDNLVVPQRWDGSDIFMVWPLPRYIFVSERMKNLVLCEAFTGCEIIPVALLESPSECGFDTHSPGRLSHYMPEHRAHELGDPLGIY